MYQNLITTLCKIKFKELNILIVICLLNLKYCPVLFLLFEASFKNTLLQKVINSQHSKINISNL